jgi:hypothetical protein
MYDEDKESYILTITAMRASNGATIEHTTRMVCKPDDDTVAV